MSANFPELNLLSVVIPARDEEGCIASTVEHLHLELQLHGIAHEMIVVDDGSADSTWTILQEECAKIPLSLSPYKIRGRMGSVVRLRGVLMPWPAMPW